MRSGFLGAVGVLLAGASVGFSQVPYYYPPYGYQAAYYAPAPPVYNGYGFAPGYGGQPVAWNGGPAAAPAGVAPAETNAPGGAAAPAPPPTPAAPAAPPPVADATAPLPAGTVPAMDLAHGPAVDGSIGHMPGPAGCPHIWATAEYLAWQLKDPAITAPFLTTGSTLDPVPGALGQPNTNIVSPSSFHFGMTPGARLDVGGWLSDDRRIGLEATGFILGSASKNYSAGSANFGTTSVLAVPAFIATTGSEGVINSSLPGANVLDATISTRTELSGAELNFLFHLYSCDWFSIGGLIGGRFLELDEDLDFGTSLVGNPVTGVPSPTLAALGFPPNFSAQNHDHWSTNNQFYGGQVGVRAEFRWWLFFADFMGKIAIGDINQVLNQTGSSTFLGGNGSAVTSAGGNFNLVTNIGSQSKDQFAVVPEVQGIFGFEVCRYVRVFAGYDFLYINTVIRPGENIDRNVNPAAVPPVLPGTPIAPLAPTRLFNSTDFWAAGITAGIELRY